MKQIARNVTMDEWGFIDNCRYLIHDRDTKYCQSFRNIIESGDVTTLSRTIRRASAILLSGGRMNIMTRRVTVSHAN
jgi:hypothetical protein